MIIWLTAIPPAVCYFLFNWQFFRCAESVLDCRPLRARSVLGTFLLNYGVFILCSTLNLHLVVNWIVFLFLLMVEKALLYRQPIQKCALFALLGTQMGLAVNILCRSLLAIVLDVPLVVFDNSVGTPGNLKSYPIVIGFLVVGVLFLLTKRLNLLKRLVMAMEDRSTLAFLLALLVAMYFYLCMNLMVYYVWENNLVLKLWSMKSSIIVIVGECLSVILSIRLGQIAVYRAKSQASREQLTKERLRELELRAIASTDPLTGCENRHQAERRVREALDQGQPFCLGFVDLDSLKSVNDGFGHEMGDRYIQAVAEALGQIRGRGDFLFRYGGDEFLMLFSEATADEAEERLRQVRQRLETKQGAFPVGISYGVAASEAGAEPADLVKAADERMYQMKRSRRSNRA